MEGKDIQFRGAKYPCPLSPGQMQAVIAESELVCFKS